MKKSTKLAVIIGTTAVSLTVAATGAQASEAGHSVSWIYNEDTGTLVSNGKCLDADLDSIDNNGTKVQLWDCNGSTEQQWQIDDINADGTVVRNAMSQRCLDADINSIDSNGTKVQLWDCDGSTEQQWRFGRGELPYNITNLASHDAGYERYLTTPPSDDQPENGTPVGLWGWN
ncbi:MAG: ricin-type beta-trefoil lectin domain protein [Kutzneria sp.]|nr:ricin-type beta-trefoil lectin domain protein [Kutzneria sp.]MBV9846217.1 ricin-type beta-trefoil lectin domain protein [Kutzneria sp.]